MEAPTATLIAVLTLGAALVLLVWAVYRRFPRIPRLETLSFWCPFKGRSVTTEFKEDAWDGKLIDVQSCDAFEPPTAVACDKLCLHLRTLPAPPKHDHAASTEVTPWT